MKNKGRKSARLPRAALLASILQVILYAGCSHSPPDPYSKQFISEKDLGPILKAPELDWDNLDYLRLTDIQNLLGPPTKSIVIRDDFGGFLGMERRWEEVGLSIHESNESIWSLEISKRWDRPFHGLQVGKRLGNRREEFGPEKDIRACFSVKEVDESFKRNWGEGEKDEYEPDPVIVKIEWENRDRRPYIWVPRK